MTPSEIADLRALCDAAPCDCRSDMYGGGDCRCRCCLDSQDLKEKTSTALSALEEARAEHAILVFERNGAREQKESAVLQWQAAESRADALQRERDEAEGGMRVYERAAKIATAERDEARARADALQAEVERLRAENNHAAHDQPGECAVCDETERQRARADAAWRAGAEVGDAGDALLVGYPITRERNRLLGAIKRFRALPPPSATPTNEEK